VDLSLVIMLLQNMNDKDTTLTSTRKESMRRVLVQSRWLSFLFLKITCDGDTLTRIEESVNFVIQRNNERLNKARRSN
ncbi:MAG: hypothetical protein ACI8RD_001174, partial [Bacillariaceae sp.]|jgi:hypothetical protein